MKKIKFLALSIALYCLFGFQKNASEIDSIAYYNQKNNPLKAINYSLKLSKTLLKDKKYDDYCTLEFKRAELFKKINDSENTLNSFYAALQVAEKNKLTDKQIFALCHIGDLHSDSFNFSQAKKYIYKAKYLSKINGTPATYRKLYQSLFKMKVKSESDSIPYYLEKIDSLTKIASTDREKAINANNFFTYYSSINNYSIAKKYILESIDYAKKAKDKKLLITFQSNLGFYYFEGIKDYKNAIAIYKNIIAEYPENEFPDILAMAYLNCSIAYENINDYKNALEYNNKYIELKDVIFSGKLQQNAYELEAKYTTQKLNEEYKNKSLKLYENQEANQKRTYLLVALFLLFIAIIYFLIQNTILKQKNKQKNKNNDLHYKTISTLLNIQNDERSKTITTLENTITQTLIPLELELSDLEKHIPKEHQNELKNTSNLIKEIHSSLEQLLHNLVAKSLPKSGLLFALNNLCKSTSTTQLQATFHSTLLENTRFSQEFEEKIYSIILELFDNCIKHSEATKIELSIQAIENGAIQIIVSDNGKGFLIKEQPFGLGLTKVKALSKSSNGHLCIQSKINIGTTIILEIKQ